MRESGAVRLKDRHVTLSHGSGGKATKNLVEGVFAPAFANAVLDRMEDAAVVTREGIGRRLAFTTDSYVVRPLFFAGGDIGSLAIHGTVNDLAVAGAEPVWLSVSVILEEGFAIEDLRRVVASMKEAAEAAGVVVVAGDTKVVERGKADGLYVNTSGVGIVREDARVSAANARPGDRVIVSGTVGDHGVAILMAREELAIETDIESDTAPLHVATAALFDALGDDVHCLRDATRGGVATALNEIAERSGVGISVDESAVPVRRDVRGACEILGIDPLHMANEGKLLAIVAGDRADRALEALRETPGCGQAAVIGEVVAEPAQHLELEVAVLAPELARGGHRVRDRAQVVRGDRRAHVRPRLGHVVGEALRVGLRTGRAGEAGEGPGRGAQGADQATSALELRLVRQESRHGRMTAGRAGAGTRRAGGAVLR
ncbi:MAG: hydrogenase expression/formation protein HypE [Gemmatimonadetes bacterium]|nr:hydrogenase expression/formation protein HypE [Gemmatimonadota bacterium]